MLRSMTAYVSTNHIYKGCSISCDIKSVNGKYLDINFKSNFTLPEVELVIRELISKKIQRGNLEINFNAETCLLYTSPSPRDAHESRMPSSA